MRTKSSGQSIFSFLVSSKKKPNIPDGYKEIKVKTADGIKIAFNELNRGRETVIIICHGINQYKDSPIFTRLTKEFEDEYDVINMDLRGHGRSGGKCTLTALEIQDLNAVVNYARKSHKKVGMLGFSLGAGTAVLETATYKNIDSLILVSPFTKISKINLKFWEKEAFIDVKEYLNNSFQRAKIGNVFLPKEDPIDVIDKIAPTPVLFLHGTEDWVFDVSHSQNLYEKAKEPKKLIIFENAPHAEWIYQRFPEEFKDACLNWFKETLREEKRK